MNKTKVKQFMRAFISTLFICVCAFILIAGIIIADVNTRALGFSETAPAISMEIIGNQITLDFLGSKYQADISAAEKVSKELEPLIVVIPPEMRLSVSAVRAVPDTVVKYIKELF